MSESEPKRRGRPPKLASERKAAGNLTIRMYGRLRSQIEQAAQVSGRSLSGEIEHRLGQSFEQEGLAEEIATLVAAKLKEPAQ